MGATPPPAEKLIEQAEKQEREAASAEALGNTRMAGQSRRSAARFRRAAASRSR